MKLQWVRVIALVFLLSLVAGVAQGAFAERFLSPRAQATADVQIYPVIGTHASFDVASYVSDFVVAYSSPQAAERAALVSGDTSVEAASSLVAILTGPNSSVLVSFTTRDPEGAEVGLRAAAQEAFRQVAKSDLMRAQIEYVASREALVHVSDEFTLDATDLSSAPPGDVVAARKAALSQAADRMELSSAAVATAQKSLTHADRFLEPLDVTGQTMSMTGDRIRIAAVATLANFLLLTGLVLLPKPRRLSRAHYVRRSGGRRVSAP